MMTTVEFREMQIKYEPRDLWVGIFWYRAGRTKLSAPTGSVTVMPEWWVWRPSDVVPNEPYTRWAGPFGDKNQADVWICKQNNWPAGLLSGKSAIVWDAPPAFYAALLEDRLKEENERLISGFF